MGGVLTERDLAGYRPVWRAPAVFDHEGWTLVTMPLPSSGGGFLLPAILEQIRFAPRLPRSGPGSIHLLAEAARRAYADRNRWLGDPDCRDVPLRSLLHPARLAALGAGIDPLRATSSATFPAPEPPAERGETTHLSVATSDGAALALTYTLNGSFGNGVVVPGLGFFLNNEMDDFSTAPGRPNLFGLVQGEANAARAGGRPLSSMTPLIVLRDGRPRWVLGSPGGSTIPTVVLQVFLNLALGGRGLAAAVAAPRFHHQHLPDEVVVEREGFPQTVLEELRRRGHAVREKPRLGEVNAVSFEEDGRLLAVADPRGYGGPAAR
jgi:gamma-glutamyltranspeptidase/glutathione hydrolase